MDFTTSTSAQLDSARSAYDYSDTKRLKEDALSGKQGALEEAAKQFEGIFVRMLLKSMRQAQDAIADKDSPFNSEQVKFYRDMHDQQLAGQLASNGSIGLAEVILQQMSGQHLAQNNSSREHASFGIFDKVQKTTNLELSTTVNGNKRAAFESPMEFVKALYPKAVEAAEKLKIDPKALLAQAAVETGWGKYVIHQHDGVSSNNLFGIKADSRWQGEKAVVDTLEYVNNQAQKEQASFRSYGDFASSLKDYVSFVKTNPRYQEAIQHTHSAATYFDKLQKAGYATDPAYADKVMAVYNSSLLNDLLP